MIRLGGTASLPHMKVFQGLETLFKRRGIEMDWVLYSDYDAMVNDFVDGKIDLAWNGPLGYVKIKKLLSEPCQVIAMRDVDFDCSICLISRGDSDILTVEDLKGRSLAVGSRASEQPLLTFHFLRQLGIDPRSGLASVSFYEDRVPRGLSGERDVVDRVATGELDAGSITRRTLESLLETGSLATGAVRTIWSSPGYSHCCFTAQRSLSAGVTKELEEAFLSVEYSDPLGKDVLDAEGCNSFALGITEGWEALEEAAAAEGLV